MVSMLPFEQKPSHNDEALFSMRELLIIMSGECSGLCGVSKGSTYREVVETTCARRTDQNLKIDGGFDLPATPFVNCVKRGCFCCIAPPPPPPLPLSAVKNDNALFVDLAMLTLASLIFRCQIKF